MIMLIAGICVLYFNFANNSKYLFERNNLYEDEKTKRIIPSVPISTMKKTIAKMGEGTLKKKLKKCLLYRRLFFASVLLFFISFLIPAFQYFPPFIYKIIDFIK